MLLPVMLGNLVLFVADVIAMLPFVLATWVLFGWCYCHVALLYDIWWCYYHQADAVACLFVLADVIATCFVTVGIATFVWFELCQRCATLFSCCFFFGRCYCQDGWWYCHCLCLANVIARWLLLLPLYFEVHVGLPAGWWNAYHGCGWQML